MCGYEDIKEEESRIGESLLFHKFLGLISVHMLASLKPVWKEEATLFLSKGFKRKCNGTVRSDLTAREGPSLRLENSLMWPTHTSLNKGHVCVTAGSLGLPSGRQNFICVKPDWWPSADGMSLASPMLQARETLIWRGQCDRHCWGPYTALGWQKHILFASNQIKLSKQRTMQKHRALQ